MRFRFSAAAGLLVLSASALAAQNGPGGAPAHPACTGLGGDACQQAVDFFHYMAPQLGTAMTGGNTTLAQGGTLGGPRFGIIPRFAIGVRVNAVLGNTPVYDPTLGAPTTTEKVTESAYVPLPAVDAAIGVFKGIPLALSNVGGIDLLVSASYVPEFSNDQVTITPDKNLALGYGVRVGLLQESLVVPGVGFSYIVRKFPVTTLTASDPAVATMRVDDLDLQSNAWRITASKSLLLFGIALGVGQDNYKMSTAAITATMTGAPGPTTTGPMESKVTRTNFFADVSMNLVVLKLVATGGMVQGGDIVTFNGYDNAADKPRPYASVGVRFGL